MSQLTRVVAVGGRRGLRKGTELGVALSVVTRSDSLILLGQLLPSNVEVGAPGGFQLETAHRKVDQPGIFSGSPPLVPPPAPTTPPSPGQHPSRPTREESGHNGQMEDGFQDGL